MRERSQNQFVFVGGDPCLDFINTEIVGKAGHTDLLQNYSDLLDWLSQAGLVNSRQASYLHKWSQNAEGHKALTRVRQIRAELRRTAEGLVRSRPVSNSTLEALNQVLCEKTQVELLARVNGRIVKKKIASFEQPDDVLFPIVESAASLLTSSQLSLVRHCEGPECILFFLDTTKNHSRRWCSMESCGNRAKVAEFRRRQSELA